MTGPSGGDGNYTPFIADIGVRVVLFTLMGRKIPEAAPYAQPGLQLALADSPTIVAENAEEWIGRGWGLRAAARSLPLTGSMASHLPLAVAAPLLAND